MPTLRKIKPISCQICKLRSSLFHSATHSQQKISMATFQDNENYHHTQNELNSGSEPFIHLMDFYKYWNTFNCVNCASDLNLGNGILETTILINFVILSLAICLITCLATTTKLSLCAEQNVLAEVNLHITLTLLIYF